MPCLRSLLAVSYRYTYDLEPVDCLCHANLLYTDYSKMGLIKPALFLATCCSGFNGLLLVLMLP